MRGWHLFPKSCVSARTQVQDTQLLHMSDCTSLTFTKVNFTGMGKKEGQSTCKVARTLPLPVFSLCCCHAMFLLLFLWRFMMLSQQLSEAAVVLRVFFECEIYCVITTALWSRDGSAVVSQHPAAASMESSVRFL